MKRIRITEIHPADNFFPQKEEFIGRILEVREETLSCVEGNNGEWHYVEGYIPARPHASCFLAIKYEEVEEELDQQKQKLLEIREIQGWYPIIGFDTEECKHERAVYAAAETGLDYHTCYKVLNTIDMDEAYITERAERMR
jgi:Tat protein secretion system quality control protein TatD with DNase activity